MKEWGTAGPDSERLRTQLLLTAAALLHLPQREREFEIWRPLM